jgi:LuxR family maltose regulon positive regulatory protein
MSARLVLVVAPAGWGKTSLLCDWCAVCEPERTAWLSVDQGDNDPARFWAGVIAALRTAWPARDPDRRPILRNRYAACGALSAGAEPLRSNSLCGALHLHD